MNFTFAVLGLGGGEIVLILAVVLLFFGGSKLPGLARGLGQSIKEFKKASRGDDEKQNNTTKAYVEKS